MSGGKDWIGGGGMIKWIWGCKELEVREGKWDVEKAYYGSEEKMGEYEKKLKPNQIFIRIKGKG